MKVNDTRTEDLSTRSAYNAREKTGHWPGTAVNQGSAIIRSGKYVFHLVLKTCLSIRGPLVSVSSSFVCQEYLNVEMTTNNRSMQVVRDILSVDDAVPTFIILGML